MNRIWSYVKKVEKSLPAQDRVAVAGELYARLKAKRIALEKEQGRKASEAEIDAMLAAEGPPEQVAARYASGPGERMDPLVGRYLSSVRRELPVEEAYDILAELRDAIRERLDAGSEARVQSKEEVAAVLKEFGPPNVVAARYRGREYLIGPKLFPWFWPAQRTALSIVLGVWIVISAVRAIYSSAPITYFLVHVWNGWSALLITFAIVTVVFLVMENTPASKRIGAMWNPMSLPEDRIREPRPLFDSILALVFDVIFILWWSGLIAFPGRERGSVAFDFAPVWDSVHVPVLVLAIVTAAVHAADIVYPAWSRLRSLVSIAGHLGGLAVMAALLQAGSLVAVTERPGGDVSAAQVQWWVDGPFRALLLFVAVCWAIGLAVEVGRQIRAVRPIAGPKPA